jgi:hypothetical protein
VQWLKRALRIEPDDDQFGRNMYIVQHDTPENDGSDMWNWHEVTINNLRTSATYWDGAIQNSGDTFWWFREEWRKAETCPFFKFTFMLRLLLRLSFEVRVSQDAAYNSWRICAKTWLKSVLLTRYDNYDSTRKCKSFLLLNGRSICKEYRELTCI